MDLRILLDSLGFVADDNVLVPMDLRLPGENEPEKYASYMLGLSFPFPRCQQCDVEHEPWKCFACHALEVYETESLVCNRFILIWRHWKACIRLRTEHKMNYKIFFSTSKYKIII